MSLKNNPLKLISNSPINSLFLVKTKTHFTPALAQNSWHKSSANAFSALQHLHSSLAQQKGSQTQ